MLAKLRERLGASEFLRHVLTLMTGTALAQAMPILASPIIARLYSPHELGIYTAFMSLVGGLVTIAAWRYDLAIVLPRKAEDARGLVKLATRANTVTCLVAGVVLLIVAKPLSNWLNVPELQPWLIGVAIMAWALSQATIFNYWSTRNKGFGLLARNRIGQSATTTATQLGFGAVQLGTAGLILSTFLGHVVSAANLFFRSRREIYGLPSTSTRAMLREHKKMPLLNAPTAVLDTVRVNGVQLLISSFFSPEKLGQFGQAWRLLQAPAALINSSLTQVFFQRLATVKRGDMVRIVWASILRSALIGLVPFLLLYLLSPALFPFIFGERWAPAGHLGAALVPWLYVNFISSPVSTVFIVTKRQGTLFWFGLPFTALPLLLIWFFHSDMLATVQALSLLMAALLTLFLVLALLVSRGFDRGVGAHAGPDSVSLEAAELSADPLEDATQ